PPRPTPFPYTTLFRSPFDDCIAADLGLEPVMRLESSVIAVRRVARGERVGYGGAWVAKRDSAIAVIAAGYGDGLHRSLGGGAPRSEEHTSELQSRENL